MTLFAVFSEGSLDVRCSFELRLKTKAKLFEQSSLFVGRSIWKFIGIDKSRRTLCRLAKML